LKFNLIKGCSWRSSWGWSWKTIL